MARVTIKDVAEKAGVSRATVSRVLNRHPTVGADLRERVLEAARTLGYQPNRAARRLRSNTSDVIGLLVSDIQNPFFTAVARGVEDAAYAQTMSLVLCNTDEDPVKQQMYLQVMQAEAVAGLIIAPTRIDDGESLGAVYAQGLPIVLLDRQVEGLEVDSVIVDNIEGAYEAVTHLVNLGYRRISIIGGGRHLSNGRQRYRGYERALRDAGYPPEPALVKTGDFKTESGYRLALELLESSRPPEAIFTANNLMTLGALRAIREHGLRIPEDIAIVGFDDMPWANELCSPLTVVYQPTYALGQEAVRLLRYRLAHLDAPFRTVTLQTRLIVRESCGAYLHSLNEA